MSDLHETHVCRDCGASITIPYATPAPTEDATPATVFYDGAHDDCDSDYRHNHSTAPLRQVLSPTELALAAALASLPAPTEDAPAFDIAGDWSEQRRRATPPARVSAPITDG